MPNKEILVPVYSVRALFLLLSRFARSTATAAMAAMAAAATIRPVGRDVSFSWSGSAVGG